MFQPAEQVKTKKFLKIAIYGEAGVGKTWFALQSPGKKAVIDTENGTDFYWKKFKFDVIKTRLYSETKKAVDLIGKNPQKYDTLIIDPITNVYQTLKDTAQRNAEIRAKRKKRNVEDANLTFRDWGWVKNKYSSLISQLCNLPCHVIITGWQKDVYEGEGDQMKKVGSRIDADKKTEYQPDVIIRLEVDKNGQRFGIVEKDRTMTYQKGQRVKEIGFEDFMGAVNQIGSVSKLETEEEAAQIEGLVTDFTMKEIENAWKELGYTASVNAQTQKLFGTDLTELSEVEALDFLELLKAKKTETQESEGGAA